MLVVIRIAQDLQLPEGKWIRLDTQQLRLDFVKKIQEVLPVLESAGFGDECLVIPSVAVEK